MSRHESPFTEAREIPVGIWPPLFSVVEKTEAFQEWRGRHCPWQLRLIGPPGCGKTTFASLMVRDLRKSFSGDGVRVASIFLRDKIQWSDDELLGAILTSLLQQLSNSATEVGQPPEDCEAIKEAISHRIPELERAFLVIDDLDTLSPSLFQKLNEDLSEFQKYGLNVLVTSRFPFAYESSRSDCDTNEDHLDVNIFWLCRTCMSDEDFVDEHGDFVICLACRKAGVECPNCIPKGPYYEPYAHRDLIMRGLLTRDRTVFAEYVAQALELAHGDLGLDSPILNKPPHSSFGRTLSMLQASNMVDKICRNAESNVSMAKLRLDMFQEAHNIDEVEKRGDRFPDNFLATFEAAIGRVLQQPEAEKKLGLYSIVATSIDDENGNIEGQSFPMLQRRLRRWGLLGDDEDDFNIDRVRRATHGLVWIKNDEGMEVEQYHYHFGLYVREDYNDHLYKVREDMKVLNRAKS